MKRTFYGIAACFLAVGCSSEPTEGGESVGESEQPILDVGSTKGLTKIQDSALLAMNDAARKANTESYYQTVVVDNSFPLPLNIDDNNSVSPATSGELKTLSAFRSRYFGGAETVASYYNRGDLGLGREMHCASNLTLTSGEVACYVKNFAAGADDSEFTFGESANIAFANMNAATPHYFATVAMVFRNGVSGGNNVFFVVYDKLDNLQTFAALDRTGELFAANLLGGNPSTNGVNFNNHAPSNCMSCHGGGGSYNSSTKVATGALFLPFDLDQFDYDTTSGKTRAAQLTKFKELNQMVWRVAALSGSDVSGSGAHPVEDLLDTWYGNTTQHETNAKDEVFSGDFNGDIIPLGWLGSPGGAAYTSVIRSSCRNCHVANMIHPFESQAAFNLVDPRVVANDLGSFAMPHSLQTVRQFWQSGQPAALANFWIARGDWITTGDGISSAAAATLQGAGPHNVATLDPPAIGIATSLVGLQ